jgi:hypothetical protein
MAKFNITVELDWMDEEFNLDDEIRETIINDIVNKVQDRLVSQTETECNNRINEQMKNIEMTVSNKLNSIMDEFFDTPRDVTDKYGDVVKRGMTVKETLKKACDDFMNQPLDEYGRPTNSSYNIKYKTRLDYFVAQSINSDMEWKIKKAVSDVTDNLKKKISEEVKKQMGDKLASILEIDKMLC